MGGPFDRDVAICLYAGLVTDTGRFQYQATTPQTLRVAAELRERLESEHNGRCVAAILADLLLKGGLQGRLEFLRETLRFIEQASILDRYSRLVCQSTQDLQVIF